MRGIYVHVPFCRRRCVYCDFYSVGERLAVWPDYVRAVVAEARARVPHYGLSADKSTLYIGGGTPSLMPVDCFVELSGALLELVGTCREFTIEVNPDDVDDAKAHAWRECGVDRISMGVQSLVDMELNAIGRRHDSDAARKAYSILRRYFDNISLDIMFGLPGQTQSSLMHTVKGIIDMRPEHISAYSLMYEERTALARMRDNGRITELPEEDCVSMFSMLSSALAEAGYGQYEISNYSLPGRQSVHNSLYWRGEPYVGLGPGAHSYDGERTRVSNNPELKAYVDFWRNGSGDMPAVSEVLGDGELREEMIMTRLRTREGLDTGAFAARFGASELRRLMCDASRWIDEGHLVKTESDNVTSLSFSHSGIMISDEIIASLF